MIELLAAIFFGGSIFIQFIFFIFLFRKIVFHEDKDLPAPVPYGVSIVVCAHNEIENLKRLLPALLAQSFPRYEIILVDDRSTDGSLDYLTETFRANQVVKILRINYVEPHISPKKNALTQGIMEAKYNHLLLTDADCLPCSTDWIRLMTQKIYVQKEVCIGYSPYEKRKSLLNLLIRFETFYTAIQYFSLALAGKPYMGVGRNLSYTKSLFLRHNGFYDHNTIWSGDDDLFGNQTFKKENISISMVKESQVLSKPKESYSKWFVQKTRHLSAGIHYKSSIKWILALLFFSHCCYYLSGVTLLILRDFQMVMIIGFIFRTLLIIYIFVQISKKLHEHFPWYLLPVLDLLYLLSYILFGINSILSKNSRWT